MAPVSSPHPTITPWPSLTPYPTASGTPTTSPFPTGTPSPTRYTEQQDDLVSIHAPSPQASTRSQQSPTPSSPVDQILDDIVTQYPTASPTPTSSPWPTFTFFPSEAPGNGVGRNVDSTPKPTSILDVLVEKYIRGGLDPTASPTPTLSAYPTASPTPTTSPFPTQSMAPTSSPWPTYVAAHNPTFSIYPTASPTPTTSPFPTSEDSASGSARSIGYGTSCSDFEKGPQQIDQEVVFTYIAEAKKYRTDFINELEIHLMDHTVAEALKCASESSFAIYRIRYPDNEAASEATHCDPTHTRSKACWILQTKMFVTTDRPFKESGKHSVLLDIQKQLNEGKLLTDTFQDLTFTKYLGPDPTEILFSQTTESEVNGTNSSSNSNSNNVALYVTIASVSMAVASVLLFVYMKRRSNRNNTTLDERSDDSIEITELLSKSRARIKDHSDHLKKQQQEGNDFVDVSFTDEPADELTTKTQTESASVSNTNSSKNLPENSTPSKSASAAQRYYQKKPQSVTSSRESPRTEDSNSSPRSQGSRNGFGTTELSRSPSSSDRSPGNNQPSRQRYLKSSRSSQGSKSPKVRSEFEGPVVSPVEHAKEGRAFKGNKSNHVADRSRQVDSFGGTSIV